MHDKANLIVHGSMNASGSIEHPITFRGDRLDYILNDILPYDRTPGQWGGIRFTAESFGNVWENVIVRNGTSGVMCDPSTPDRPKIRIHNSQITNMGGDVFTAFNCDVTATNSEFSNAGGSVLILSGGSYYLAHCTVANYMSLTQRGAASASPLDSKSLHLLHNTAAGEAPPYPILQAHFDNCLIDGSFSAGNPLSATGEIGIVASATNEEEDFDYRFNHCVLKAQSIESEHFIETLFINPQEPPYRMTGGEANKYIYDFVGGVEHETAGIGKTQDRHPLTRNEKAFLKECRQVIKDNIDNPDFNAEFLAGKLSLSHSSLYKKIRTLTGMSLIEFINDYKISVAVNLFNRGETNVETVCLKCGFRDVKNFRNLFRRKTGLLPKQYVDSLR